MHIEKRGLGGYVVPIFISVDPLRDTVGQLKNYGQDFHKSMVSTVTQIFIQYY